MASLIAGKRQKSSVSLKTSNGPLLHCSNAPPASNLRAPSIKHQTSGWSLASRPRPHPRQKLSGSQKYTSRAKVPESIPVPLARVQAWPGHGR